MRILIAAIACVALIGCGGSDEVSTPEVRYPANVAPRYLPGSDFDFIQEDRDGAAEEADPVVYSFATWGCNRVGWDDVSKWASSANEPWLTQLMEDVRKMPEIDPSLKDVPPHLFFTGDLVLNEVDDEAKTLKSQLEAWVKFYQQQPLWTGQANLPFLMLGNHEALISVEGPPKVYNEYLPKTDINVRTWLDILRAGNFFVPPSVSVKGIQKSSASRADEVASSHEAFASYSVTVGDLHFVVLNTDTFTDHMDGEHPAIGWVQLQWLEQDLTAAEQKGAERIFVFGHKPAVAFPGSGQESQKGDLHVYDDLQQAFIDTLNRHPKVAAYVCAHAHAWGVHELSSPGIEKKTMQLIAGNGGSPLQPSWQPSEGVYFGPTIVKVHRSGRVVAESYGRPVPNPYTNPPTGELRKMEQHQLFPIVAAGG